jgi:hypothetical protein
MAIVVEREEFIEFCLCRVYREKNLARYKRQTGGEGLGRKVKTLKSKSQILMHCDFQF